MNKASNKQALSLLVRGIDVPQTSFPCTFVGWVLRDCHVPAVGPPSSQSHGRALAPMVPWLVQTTQTVFANVLTLNH